MAGRAREIVRDDVIAMSDDRGVSRAQQPRRLFHYPLLPEFQGISYAQRYEIFCERLVRERLYDATCFLMSSQQGGLAGEYIEPNPELSFPNFAAMLSARAAAFVKLKGA
jgi:hypothetical protein